jgi:hypothetical protein
MQNAHPVAGIDYPETYRNSLIGLTVRSPAVSTSESVGGPMDLFVAVADQ